MPSMSPLNETGKELHQFICPKSVIKKQVMVQITDCQVVQLWCGMDVLVSCHHSLPGPCSSALVHPPNKYLRTFVQETEGTQPAFAAVNATQAVGDKKSTPVFFANHPARRPGSRFFPAAVISPAASPVLSLTRATLSSKHVSRASLSTPHERTGTKVVHAQPAHQTHKPKNTKTQREKERTEPRNLQVTSGLLRHRREVLSWICHVKLDHARAFHPRLRLLHKSTKTLHFRCPRWRFLI